MIDLNVADSICVCNKNWDSYYMYFSKDKEWKCGVNIFCRKVKIYFNNHMTSGFGITFLTIYLISVRLVEMTNDIHVAIIKRKWSTNVPRTKNIRNISKRHGIPAFCFHFSVLLHLTLCIFKLRKVMVFYCIKYYYFVICLVKI